MIDTKINKKEEIEEKNKNFAIRRFKNLSEIKEFYFRFIFKFIYFEKVLDLNNSSDNLNFENDPILFSELEVQNYIKPITYIQNSNLEYTKLEKIQKFCIIKFNFSLSSLTNKELFTKDFIIKNYQNCAEITRRETLKLIKFELNKILPEMFNRSILRYIRKADLNSFLLKLRNFNLHISKPDYFKGIQVNKLGLRLVILNFGPGEIELFTLNRENKIKLENYLIQNFQISFQNQNELVNWFPPIDMLVKNEIEFTYSIIKENEIVFLPVDHALFYKIQQSETFFITYHSLTLDVYDCEILFEKYSKLISNKIPFEIKIHTLFLEILNSNLNSLSMTIELASFLKEKLLIFTENEYLQLGEIKAQNNFILNKIQYELDEVNSKFCENCFEELFNFYGICLECDCPKRNGKLTAFKCLKCLQNHNESNILLDIDGCNFNIFFKYSEKAMKKLFERVDKAIKRKLLIQENIQSLNMNNTQSSNNLIEDSILNDFQPELAENFKFYIKQQNQIENYENYENCENYENYEKIENTNKNDISFPKNLEKTIISNNNLNNMSQTREYNQKDFIAIPINFLNEQGNNFEKFEEYSKDDIIELAKIEKDIRENNFISPNNGNVLETLDFLDFNN
jgi:hypothetical protein